MKRYISLCMFLLISLMCIAQQEIPFEELHETYDTSGNHHFLRHVYKHIKFPDEFNEIDTVLTFTIQYGQGEFITSMKNSDQTAIDSTLLHLIDSACHFLADPDEEISTNFTIAFDYVWGIDSIDSRNNLKEKDIVVSRFPPISCGPAPKPE